MLSNRYLRPFMTMAEPNDGALARHHRQTAIQTPVKL